MRLKDLSLTELKAAYDFIQIHLEDFEAAGRDKNKDVTVTDAYKDYAQLSSSIQDGAMTRVALLE